MNDKSAMELHSIILLFSISLSLSLCRAAHPSETVVTFCFAATEEWTNYFSNVNWSAAVLPRFELIELWNSAWLCEMIRIVMISSAVVDLFLFVCIWLKLIWMLSNELSLCVDLCFHSFIIHRYDFGVRRITFCSRLVRPSIPFRWIDQVFAAMGEKMFLVRCVTIVIRMQANFACINVQTVLSFFGETAKWKIIC